MRHKFTVKGKDFDNPKAVYKKKWHNWFMYCERCNQNKAKYNQAKLYDFGKNTQIQHFAPFPDKNVDDYNKAKLRYQNTIKEYQAAQYCS